MAADTFAGEFFTEEIERQSRYNVVEIEVSFVSKGRDSVKYLRSSLAVVCEYCMTITHLRLHNGASRDQIEPVN